MLPEYRKRIVWGGLWASISLFLLHMLALREHLYWSLWWFDILMHILGGFIIGIVAYWFLLGDEKNFLNYSSHSRVFLLLSITLLIGLAWEFFEYAIGFTYNSLGNYPLDTLKDIIDDLLGAYLGYLLLAKKLSKLV